MSSVEFRKNEAEMFDSQLKADGRSQYSASIDSEEVQKRVHVRGLSDEVERRKGERVSELSRVKAPVAGVERAVPSGSSDVGLSLERVLGELAKVANHLGL
jgi:hypothetical protein